MAKKRIKRPNNPAGDAVPQTPTIIVNDPTSSVDFSRDAKGQPRWTIKVYGDADQMDEVLDEVLRLDRELLRRTTIGEQREDPDDE